MKSCELESCGRKHYAKGLCFLHYQRQWRGNDIVGDIRHVTRNPFGVVRTASNGYRYIHGLNAQEHRSIAECVLGRKLKADEVVHHIDENKENNNKANLLICNRSYHAIIHTRMNALKDCGDANKRLCVICRKYDSTENMSRKGRGFRHKECHRLYEIHRRNKSGD